jgi:hypothetical protein
MRYLVVQQGRFDVFRATRMIQDKAQPAVNGMPFTRVATPYWIIRVAPFGRAAKRLSALLRLLTRTRHCRRDAPSGQPLRSLAEPTKPTLLDH